MTDLDRRVAELRGWTIATLDDDVIGPEQYWVKDGVAQWPIYSYQPHRVLKQAFALWNEARPDGWRIQVGQAVDGMWYVEYESVASMCDAKCKEFTDLPRAITEAWVEAMEEGT